MGEESKGGEKEPKGTVPRGGGKKGPILGGKPRHTSRASVRPGMGRSEKAKEEEPFCTLPCVRGASQTVSGALGGMPNFWGSQKLHKGGKVYFFASTGCREKGGTVMGTRKKKRRIGGKGEEKLLN